MRLSYLVCAVLLAAAGCSASPKPEAAPAKPPSEVVFFQGEKSIVVADGQGKVLSSDATVADANWSQLYAVRGSDLVSFDPVAGKETYRVPVPAGFTARVVSTNDGLVALTNAGGGGRSETAIVVADPSGARPVTELKLKGNFVPEAFSADGKGLFVLEFLPANAPERYRVRKVDLSTQKVEPLLLRTTKTAVPPQAEEEMRGEGRQAVLSPGRDRLYTLYLHQADHKHTRDLLAGPSARGGRDVHAFVHVLSLTEGWAYCLDLPAPFGTHPPGTHAMTISPDGQTLYVAEMTSKKLLTADTESLTVKKVATLNTAQPPGDATTLATTADGSSLYLGSSTTVFTVDPLNLQIQQTWPQPAPIRGLAPTPAGLFIGQSDTITRLDPLTGKPQSTLTGTGLRNLLHAGNPLE